MSIREREQEAPEQARTRFAKDQLKAFVERIERLESEKADIASDIKDVYGEAKSSGFDVTALRAIIRLRKQEPTERNEQQLILETYMNALGMLPLFERDTSSEDRGGSGQQGGAGNGSGGSAPKGGAQHRASMSSNSASAKTGIDNPALGTENSCGGEKPGELDNPRLRASGLQQGSATTSTASTAGREARAANDRDAGNVAKPKGDPTAHRVTHSPSQECSSSPANRAAIVESPDQPDLACLASMAGEPPRAQIASQHSRIQGKASPPADDDGGIPPIFLIGHPECWRTVHTGPPDVRPP